MITDREILAKQIAHELLHNDAHPDRGAAVLTAVLCDDWLIFARDRDGSLYMVSTELWSEWLDCPPGADHEPNAVLTHMLPVAWEKGYFHHAKWWERLEPEFAADLPTEPLGGVAFWDPPAPSVLSL